MLCTLFSRGQIQRRAGNVVNRRERCLRLPLQYLVRDVPYRRQHWPFQGHVVGTAVLCPVLPGLSVARALWRVLRLHLILIMLCERLVRGRSRKGVRRPVEGLLWWRSWLSVLHFVRMRSWWPLLVGRKCWRGRLSESRRGRLVLIRSLAPEREIALRSRPGMRVRPGILARHPPLHIWIRLPVQALVAEGPRPLAELLDAWGAAGPRVLIFHRRLVVPVGLAVPSAHPHIAADTHAAALLGHDSAQVRALGEPWELLRTVDHKLG